MPSSYSDYAKYKIDWKDPNDYSVVKEIGKGGYSEVFECYKEADEFHEEIHAVIKILKPINDYNVAREIKVLEILKGGPSIVKFIEPVKDEEDETSCLVFEYTKMVNLYDVKEIITPKDIKIFLFKILEAMDYAHSKGIMHRDIKMQNILVDMETKELQIIDWGLSEFYHPKFAYNTKVSTRSYRAPELIVGYPYYDYSLDIWWIGVLFGELLLNKFPLIASSESKAEASKLVKRRKLVKETNKKNTPTNSLSPEFYIKLLGYQEFKEFLSKYNINAQIDVKESCKKWTPVDFRDLFTKEREEFMDEQALDLLSNLLRLDKEERLTAKEALEHSYFDSILN